MSTDTPARTGVRPAVAVIGLAYLVLGVAGFFVPETVQPGHDPSRAVWIFSSTTLLNAVHTGVGLFALLSLRRPTAVLACSWAAFVLLTGLTAYGILAAAFGPREDPVNINWADNWLHGLTALAALALGVALTRAGRREPRHAG